MADTGKQGHLPDRASFASPDSTEALSGEALLDALKLILIGAPLAEALTNITRLIEAQRPGMLCSIFLLDADGVHLRYAAAPSVPTDRKSTRLNSSHLGISYAVFCLKKKRQQR